MFKIFISKQSDFNNGFWIDLPIGRGQEVRQFVDSIQKKYGDCKITKCIHSELSIHIDIYQQKSFLEDLSSINSLALDYNDLNTKEKQSIKNLSDNGEYFEELVGEMIDNKVRSLAQYSLDNFENINKDSIDMIFKNLFKL